MPKPIGWCKWAPKPMRTILSSPGCCCAARAPYIKIAPISGRFRPFGISAQLAAAAAPGFAHRGRPSFLWRESWLGKVKGYRSDAFFGRPDPGARFQSAWIWSGGNVEIEARLSFRNNVQPGLARGFLTFPPGARLPASKRGILGYHPNQIRFIPESFPHVLDRVRLDLEAADHMNYNGLRGYRCAITTPSLAVVQ